MIDSRTFKKGNEIMNVIIDYQKENQIGHIWFNIEVNENQIESGFLTYTEYKQKIDKENWIIIPELNGQVNRMI